MARYKIELTVEDKNIKTVERKLKEHFGKEAATSAHKVEISESRADRLGNAQGLVSDATGEVEALKDELQSWYDNLPENLQSGSKGDELSDAISQLEDLHSTLESADFDSVSFPSMY